MAKRNPVGVLSTPTGRARGRTLTEWAHCHCPLADLDWLIAQARNGWTKKWFELPHYKAWSRVGPGGYAWRAKWEARGKFPVGAVQVHLDLDRLLALRAELLVVGSRYKPLEYCVRW